MDPQGGIVLQIPVLVRCYQGLYIHHRCLDDQPEKDHGTFQLQVSLLDPSSMSNQYNHLLGLRGVSIGLMVISSGTTEN